ncbi:MAG: metal ABC transporter permease [Planctomycetes bacterium]|nr:metal ABC transporter permease [Planctomycetota bacterium]
MDAVFFHSMLYPFLACLVVTGIHVYLGIHVIERKVIFVDLALATLAAFGVVWGALLGWESDAFPWAAKGFALAFTFVGSAVFSMTRMKHERVPHEAIIGITYAVALAATMLASAKLPHGAEEVHDLQAGSILLVNGATIVETAIGYTLIGIFHYVFRARFLAISIDPARAEAEGVNVRLWDFLFYVSLGFVVTRSVSIAGVLLVFSYLVIPAVVAVLFAERIGVRLVIGWTVATLVSALGVWISYYQDLPSGPVIVVCFGGFLALAGVVHFWLHSSSRMSASLRVALGAVAFTAFFGGSLLLRRHETVDVIRLLQTGAKSERMIALLTLEAQPELWPEVRPLVPDLLANADVEVRSKLLDLVAERHALDFLPQIHGLLRTPNDLLREQALKTVRRLAQPASAAPILAAAAVEEDDDLKVEMAEAALELGDASGVPFLLDVMEAGDAQQARTDAFEHLRAHVDSGLPFHAEGDATARRAEVAALRDWWRAHPSSFSAAPSAVPSR